jgi:hypothetical protein
MRDRGRPLHVEPAAPPAGTISSSGQQHLEMPTALRIGVKSVECQIECENCQSIETGQARTSDFSTVLHGHHREPMSGAAKPFQRRRKCHCVPLVWRHGAGGRADRRHRALGAGGRSTARPCQHALPGCANPADRVCGARFVEHRRAGRLHQSFRVVQRKTFVTDA